MSERLIIQPKSPWTEAEIGGIILSLISQRHNTLFQSVISISDLLMEQPELNWGGS